MIETDEEVREGCCCAGLLWLLALSCAGSVGIVLLIIGLITK